MPIHNAAWSTASLARNLLDGLDRNKPDTTLPTATLELLLNTVLDLTVGGQKRDLNDAAMKAVDGRIAQFGEASRAAR